jgi:hypothetical protein
MALSNSTPAKADLDDDEIPAGVPRHGRDGRPKIRHADDPTKMSYYTRASSFGEVIEDKFLVHRSQLRQVVFAMGRFDALVMESQAVEALEDKEDAKRDRAMKDELSRVADRAIERVGGNDKATKGTALHTLRERRDRGEDLAFVGPKTWAALDAWSAMASCFTWHGSEQFVVNHRWRTAGTYDALWSPKWPWSAPDGALILPGERICADLKSGSRGPDWWGPTYGSQLTVYPNSQPYEHVSDEEAAEGDNGLREWPDGVAPRTDWALIPHVPLEHPEDAGLWWVDLTKGAVLANLAFSIREARKLDGLFLPAELPAEPVEPARERIEVHEPASWSVPARQKDCRECNYDRHRCPGCGEPLPHGTEVCNVAPCVSAEQITVPTPRPDFDAPLFLISQAQTMAEIDALYDANAERWTDDLTEAVKARLTELDKEAS